MQRLFLILALIIVVAVVGVFVFWKRDRSETPRSLESPRATEQRPRPMYTSFPGVLSKEERIQKKARVTTTKGDIVIELFGDEAPKAASNFITLAKDGFYDGLTFHRREEGFVIQGGDPNGDGTGGPGYRFEDEPVRRSYTKGIVAMANAGPNTNGSQFFIMLANYTLPPLYTIFGNVVEGHDVVDQIQVGDVMTRVTIE